MENVFDIVVVGGGHAGVEAVWISSQFGIKVGLISGPDVPIASAPCNPSIGGVGKGQVVKELDCLGGLMGLAADKAGIQYRTLNESKGFAVQSTRVQIDKIAYSEIVENELSAIDNLKIIRKKVIGINKTDICFEILLDDQTLIMSKKVIVTAGTFLNGKLHTGEETKVGGREGSSPSVSLSELIGSANLYGGRFKTGTPARLNKDSINYFKLEVQPSDDKTLNFSIHSSRNERSLQQVDCYLAYTNSKTLSIIRSNKERSPIFNGQIKGIGPRYCPSIEDKAFRYTEKDIHHVFIEPESHQLNTVYPSGISTSLPKDVQESFIHSIEGLEESKIEVYGYAVEYDVVDTTKLRQTLECKDIQGLYFAGQICGTSGYEEAAGQGFIAGVNASLNTLGFSELLLSREDSYIGLMIEDLVSSKRDEPYRLFTARSENRLHIREDNTFLRMFNYRERMYLNNKVDHILRNLVFEYDLLSTLLDKYMFYSNQQTKTYFEEMGYGSLETNISLRELLRRPNLNPVETLNSELNRLGSSFSSISLRSAAISSKYEGYVTRMNAENEKMIKLNSKKINIEELLSSKNISFECMQRIKKVRPETFGQLKKVEGIRPATLAYVAGNLL